MTFNQKWKIVFAPKAHKEFDKLQQTTQKRIERYLRQLIEWSHPPKDGRAMTGTTFKSYWRYRVGDYRIICRIEDNDLIIVIVRVAHRKHVYNTTLH